MKNKYTKTLLIVMAFLILTITTIASYAYFTASVSGNTTASNNVITTGTMQLLLTDGEYVSLENAIPGTSVTKTFKVKNTGTVETNYDIYLSELINNFVDKNDLVYTLTSANGCPNATQTVVPDEVGEQSKIVSSCLINPNQEHEYSLTITFKEDGTNQDDNKTKKFSAKISVNEYQEYEYIGYLQNGNAFSNSLKTISGDKSNITSIIRSNIEPTQENNAIDVSIEPSDKPVYIWYEQGTIKIYTKNKKVYLNEDSMSLFSDLSNMTSIDLSLFDTSNVTNMFFMFGGCSSLVELDLSNFNTQNVTDMTYMFSSMKSLENIIFGNNFNTSNVEYMIGMFLECSSMKKLDLSFFDTSNVTDMSNMFHLMRELEELNVSSFDTSNVTSMNHMFCNLDNLKSIDLTNFNTSNVNGMNSMFYGDFALENLDISSFDTSNVESMNNMFFAMKKIEKIYVGNKWSIAKINKQSANSMFSNDYNLVGESGTKFASNHSGWEYAHVDEGSYNPGYFTLKSN